MNKPILRFDKRDFDHSVELYDDGAFVLHTDYAALESLLLDARATGLKLMGDLQRAEALAVESGRRYETVRAWFIRGGGRSEIAPNGHIKDITEAEFDAAIDAVGGWGKE